MSTCENWDLGVVDCPYMAYTRPQFVYQTSITGLENTLHQARCDRSSIPHSIAKLEPRYW
ncbi:hypothetical protein [Nostoc sp.]|uniref:hypothetical protein n=1 Tax=Nostoc sp. TaxID=1180 RepID=UPI002FFABC36